MKFNVPVLLIIFNRLDTTEQVLAVLRKAGIAKLYIFCDGPRNAEESVKLASLQKQLLAMIDWPCAVVTKFCDINKGPRVAVGEGITWFFDNEIEGIVLEHDCLPHISFFSYCEQLLEKYRDDERIMHISGDNFQFGKKYGQASYYFSRYNHIWGFATWRRAWKYYDNSFSAYPQFAANNTIQHIFCNKREIAFWENHFRLVHEGKMVTWDAQWTLSMWLQNGLAIIPQVNLVANIGFGELSLNTQNTENRMAAIPTHDIGELIHPEYILPNTTADTWGIYDTFDPPFITLLKRKIKRLLK
ncbi:MAG: hypothetical protein HYZ42_02780 [Bacteroidetes bacterium]|nr:hypothetical protein [Bacteroidota bacterium]